MMKMSGFPPGFPPFFLRSLKTALISSNTQFWRGGYVRTSHWGKNRSKGQKWGFGHSVQKLDRPINRDLYRTTCIHEVLWLSWDQCTEQCFVPVQLLYPFLFSFSVGSAIRNRYREGKLFIPDGHGQKNYQANG